MRFWWCSLCLTARKTSVALITKYTDLNNLFRYKPGSCWVCDGVGGSGLMLLLAPFFTRRRHHRVFMIQKMQQWVRRAVEILALVTTNHWTCFRLAFNHHTPYFLFGVSNIAIV